MIDVARVLKELRVMASIWALEPKLMAHHLDGAAAMAEALLNYERPCQRQANEGAVKAAIAEGQAQPYVHRRFEETVG